MKFVYFCPILIKAISPSFLQTDPICNIADVERGFLPLLRKSMGAALCEDMKDKIFDRGRLMFLEIS